MRHLAEKLVTILVAGGVGAALACSSSRWSVKPRFRRYRDWLMGART